MAKHRGFGTSPAQHSASSRDLGRYAQKYLGQRGFSSLQGACSRALGSPSAAWPPGTAPQCHPQSQPGGTGPAGACPAPCQPLCPCPGTGGREAAASGCALAQGWAPLPHFPASWIELKTPETPTKTPKKAPDRCAPNPDPCILSQVRSSLESSIKSLPPLPPGLRGRVTVPCSEEVNSAPGNYI